MVRPLSVLCVALLSSVSASAGVLNDFNMIAFGNLTGTSEVEGRSLVEGNIVGNAKNFAIRDGAIANPTSTKGVAQTDSLIVGGQVQTTIQVNRGNVLIGGTQYKGSQNPVQINNSPSVKYQQDVQGILTQAKAEIGQIESYFKSLTVNSVIDFKKDNVVQFVSNPVKGISVFDTDASMFKRNGVMDLVNAVDSGLAPTGDLFLIRVSGEQIDTSGGLNVFDNEFKKDSGYQQRIVWYFPEATSLDVAKGLGGSVIAPRANIRLGSPIEGTVVGRDINLTAEIHLPTLMLPALPTPSSDTPAKVVPEPASIASFGFMLCAAIAGYWRRKSLGHA